MIAMKMPWTRRAEEEREHRIAAEERREATTHDWIQIRRYKQSIDREIELNDWTEAAVKLFSGRSG